MVFATVLPVVLRAVSRTMYAEVYVATIKVAYFVDDVVFDDVGFRFGGDVVYV